MSATRPSVVAIGGGHGTAVTLGPPDCYAGTLTGVVSVADDGGSSGRLRELLNVVAVGDLRKCLVAVADEDSALAVGLRAPLRRGGAGRARAGQPDPGRADRRHRRPGPRGCARRPSCSARAGDILPATTERVVLKAEAAEGTVAGQVAVMGTGDIRTVSLVPGDAQPPPLAVERIAEADQIVIGPGSLFTSVLAAVAVRGITEAVASSAAAGRLRLQPASPGPRDRGLRRGSPRCSPGQARCRCGRRGV